MFGGVVKAWIGLGNKITWGKKRSWFGLKWSLQTWFVLPL